MCCKVKVAPTYVGSLIVKAGHTLTTLGHVRLHTFALVFRHVHSCFLWLCLKTKVGHISSSTNDRC